MKQSTRKHRGLCAPGILTASFHAGGLVGLVLGALLAAPPTAISVEANQVAEVALVSGMDYANPFLQIQLDAVVTQPDGTQLRVPGFWAGGIDWRFRYASGKVGLHSWRTECSDTNNAGLHGVTGSISVLASTSTNLLFLHGPIRVAADQRHFEHTDGTPFLWLGDTWWKGLCQRLTWDGFQQLTADRRAKGFNVVQIVCGPYPDEDMMQASWENEGGKSYLTNDFSILNPSYFTYADRRIQNLADRGLVPAIVSGWGRPQAGGLSTIAQVGLAGYERHVRYLIARYGAYPVVWIIGGETDQTQGPWYQLAQYLHGLDPYHRLLVNHTSLGRTGLEGSGAFDFDMDVVGHNSWTTVNDSIAQITTSRSLSPVKPVLTGEACYERHMQQNLQDVQRYLFWGCVLSGAAGHTYGAAGVWNASVLGDPGTTPVYDWTPLEVGRNYPGSTQVGLCRKLLEQYPWWRFVPHPEWTTAGFAAGIPNEARVIYIPNRGVYNWSGISVNDLEPGVSYAAFFFDPATGRRFDQGIVATAGTWNTPAIPSPQDWVLVMQAVNVGNPVIGADVAANQACSGQLGPAGATFSRVAGPGWLTIHPDGSFTGVPGQLDIGTNTWIVSVVQAGGGSTFVQLQITVVGTANFIFAENFNSYSGTENGVQYQSALNVAYSGSVGAWTKSGYNAIHAADLANNGGLSNPSDWAVMFYQDNFITSGAIAANTSGQAYRVDFETSAAVYSQSSQATQTGDALAIQVLRGDNSVLASHTNWPGAWAGNMLFTPDSFQYAGDGSGNVRLRIGPAGSLATGRFQGAIDNIVVSKADISQPAFRISHYNLDPVAGTLSIRWGSAPGTRYDLVSGTSLAAPVAGWTAYRLTNLVAFPPENSLLLSPIPEDANRFFSIRAYPAQP